MSLAPLLVFHVSAGAAGLLSGTAAIVLRKGSYRHAVAGQVFVVAIRAIEQELSSR